MSRFFYTSSFPFNTSADPDAGGPATSLISISTYDLTTGLVLSTTDANSQTTTMEYAAFDALGNANTLQRLTKVTRPDGGWTSYGYSDTPGALSVLTRTALDPSRYTEATQYFDGLGRAWRTAQSEGTTSIFMDRQYDSMGRVWKSSNPYRSEDLVWWTTTTFDALGRVTSVTSPDNAVVGTAYSGSRILVTDQALRQRLSETNALGQLENVWEIKAAGAATESVSFFGHSEVTAGYRTTYEYDSLDSITKVTQGSQPPRTFVYDSLKRLTSAVNPESGTMSYQYDDNGNLLVKTDARGVSTHFSYDALNRVVRRWYNGSNSIDETTNNNPALPFGVGASPEVNYSYDLAGMNSKGRLASVTSSGSSYVFGNYDAMGRVLTATQTTDIHNYPMSYGYDLAGNMTSETYPSGRVVKSEYDIAGRLAGAKNQATGLYYAGAVATDASNRIQYTAHGEPSQMRLGNGLWEHASFNSRLHPLQIGLGTSGTNSSVLQLDFGYGTTGNNGNLLSQTITIPGLTLSQAFSYDQLNRLETANEGGGANWKQKFLYDRYANRRIDSDSANTTPGLIGANPVLSETNNRIVAQAGELYLYDPAGNLIRGREGQTYEFDAESKMTSFNGGASQGGANYSYDGDGRRVKKVAGTVTTVFIYDVSGRLVAEYSGAPPEANGTRYLTSDHLGTARVLTDSNGAVKSRHDYLPFGEEINAGTGGRGAAHGYVGDNLRQKFTAKERDNETQLDYFLARYYSASQGRFTTVDPLRASAKAADPQTWNRYAYVLNRPMIAVDPDGLSVIIVVLSPRSRGGSGNAATLVMDRRGAIVPVGRHGSNSIPSYAVGNQSDRTKKYADTPFGVYSIYRDNRSDTDANGNHTGTQGGSANSRPRGIAFGTGIIYMKAEAGEVVQSNRDTIYFHGGGTALGSHAFDPDQPLVATHGCIRLHNQDVNALIQTVNNLDTNGDPITGIFVGDAATLFGLAAQTGRNGAYLYPELRIALGLDQPPPPPQNDDDDDEDE